jgi:hypothetical protein
MRGPGRLSLLARFVVLGGLAFGAKRLLFGAQNEVHPLSVEVARDATRADIERAVEEAMLLDVAERAELPQVDAVVRERVVRSLAVVEDVSDSNAAVRRGLSLGLHRQDVVARERLIANARELLFAAEPPAPPSDEETQAFLEAHQADYASPPRVQFKQLFLSREKRGASLVADAGAMLPQLRSGGAPEGDAWAWTHANGQYSEARLDALAGPGFGAQVLSAPVGAWSGPIESSFGLHFVWVTAVTPAAPSPLPIALPRARADLVARERQRAREEKLAALRASYRVSWVRR